MTIKGKKKKNQVVTVNIFEQQELLKKAEVIREDLTALTWCELETSYKFGKNEKLSFVSDDMPPLESLVSTQYMNRWNEERWYMIPLDMEGLPS